MSSDIRICFIGDSLVNGTGDETALGWTGRVCAAAFASGTPVTYYNLGVRGETTRDIRLRWERECAVRLPQSVEGRIVLSCGVNDSVLEAKGGTRVRFEESLRNVTQILRAAVRYQRLVVGPPPAGDAAHTQRIAALSNAFAHEMTQLNLPYVDLFKPLANDAVYLASLRAGDGYHPTSVGYVRMADAVKASPAWWFK
jgi:acyl-CoA thioesterase I